MTSNHAHRNRKTRILTRRQMLKIGALAGAGLFFPWEFLRHGQSGSVIRSASAQESAFLDPRMQPKFVNQLPNPLDPRLIFAPAAGAHTYRIGMFQIQQSLGLINPSTGVPLTTTLWGYGGQAQQAGLPFTTYPGRTFVARRGSPINVQWTNNLVGDSGAPLPHLLPVDTTIHWANPTGVPSGSRFVGPVPTVPHLHGGHTESASDGRPESWWTPWEAYKGATFVKSLYRYDNDQEAATLWYHDHTLGLTRLNVYAGLAGFYILRDDRDTGLTDNQLGLPSFPYEIPLLIQDRLFTAQGQLFYPTTDPELPADAPDPSALPEFFGNVILVNGVAWPVLDVEPRRYRFRLLNGSDSRFYNLWINSGSGNNSKPDGDGPQLIQIGTDDGFLTGPVPLDHLVIGPGERADVVVDFAGFKGETLILRNNARAPFPMGETPDPRTIGQIMAFRVGRTVRVPDQPLAAALRSSPFHVSAPFVPRRQLILVEAEDAYGRLRPQLGILQPGSEHNGSLLWHETVTENPRLNSVEMWEVFNATEDAHPIHLHLVRFQILDRQKFNGEVVLAGAAPHEGGTKLALKNIRLLGNPRPPAANEAGPKDTAQMFPGEVTRLIARFDRPGQYVWHCHILSHEDHEMMRPFRIIP